MSAEKHKKQLGKGETGLRLPQRSRGQARFNTLLDAAQTLLSRDETRDISLGDVADVANVPLPSLYHFFTNRNSLLLALARRHLDALTDLSTQRLDLRPVTWQELVCRRQSLTAEYLNAHPDAMRLFMGAGVSAEVRMLDLRGNLMAAGRRAAEMRGLFDCTGLAGLDGWMSYHISLTDGIWAQSWGVTRRITGDAILEANRAGVAYLRVYLPELLPPRGDDDEQS